MKPIATGLFILISLFSFSQTTEVVVPANTNISMILTQEVREFKNKKGEAVKFVVIDDVVVDGVVVVAKNTPVNAKITTLSKDGDMRIDLFDVAAVDGTILTLNDCWHFTTRAQNLNSKGALVVKGVRKTCATAVSAVVKNTTGRF